MYVIQPVKTTKQYWFEWVIATSFPSTCPFFEKVLVAPTDLADLGAWKLPVLPFGNPTGPDGVVKEDGAPKMA